MSAAVDPFQNTLGAPRHSYTNAAAVTPSDTVDLSDVTQALYVGGAGALAVITMAGQTVTFAAVAAGTTHELRVSRVKATGTVASSIVAHG